MPGAVLLFSGLVTLAYGSWRGYAAARTALRPLARDGDPTRRLIDAARPAHERARVRGAARHVLLAVAWLSVATYGLFLATVGVTVLR
jgi:hypothetical protein